MRKTLRRRQRARRGGRLALCCFVLNSCRGPFQTSPASQIPGKRHEVSLAPRRPGLCVQAAGGGRVGGRTRGAPPPWALGVRVSRKPQRWVELGQRRGARGGWGCRGRVGAIRGSRWGWGASWWGPPQESGFWASLRSAARSALSRWTLEAERLGQSPEGPQDSDRQSHPSPATASGSRVFP